MPRTTYTPNDGRIADGPCRILLGQCSSLRTFVREFATMDEEIANESLGSIVCNLPYIMHRTSADKLQLDVRLLLVVPFQFGQKLIRHFLDVGYPSLRVRSEVWVGRSYE